MPLYSITVMISDSELGSISKITDSKPSSKIVSSMMVDSSYSPIFTPSESDNSMPFSMAA